MYLEKERMSKQTIFGAEEKIVTEAEEVLKDEKYHDTPLHKPFSHLLKSYKRIYKQLRKLIKLSDKQQLRLNELNEMLENENYELMMELGQAFESFVRALSTAVDAKHPITAGHSHRVTEYSLLLGRHLDLDDNHLELLKYTGLLHDIGKIGVPDVVLTKKGRFTPQEREIMNEHSLWTFRIIDGISLPKILKELPRIAACHHEKLDGTGYPYRLVGESIPFFARILAVGDVFDALTSRRDYPKYDGAKTLGFDPMTMDRVFSILDKDKGSHFDPAVVDTAIKKESELKKLWEFLHDQ